MDFSTYASRFMGAEPVPLFAQESPDDPFRHAPDEGDSDHASSSHSPPRQPFVRQFFRSADPPHMSAASSAASDIDQGPGPSSAPLNVPRPTLSRAPHLRHLDSIWASLYLIFLTCFFALSLYAAFDPPPLPPQFVAFLPLLTALAFVSFLLGLVYLVLLHLLRARAATPLLYLSLGAPSTLLLLASLYAFMRSWDLSGSSANVARGLRWGSASGLVSSCFFLNSAVRSFPQTRKSLQVLELASEAILAHPLLLFLAAGSSLLFLVLALLSSLLFLTLIPAHHPWFASFVGFFSLWSLAVLRGTVRLTVAGVVADWFFNRHEHSHPHSTTVFKLSFDRARGPLFGTAVVAGLFLTLVDTLSFILSNLLRLRTRAMAATFPSPFLLLAPIFWLATPIFALAAAYLDAVNAYVLVYSGITGNGFWDSTRAVSDIISSAGSQIVADRLVIKTVLNLAAFIVSLLSTFIAFLTLYSHHELPSFAYSFIFLLLAGFLPFWSLRVSSDLITHATDTLFISYSIDLNTGTSHSAKAADAFADLDDDPALPR